MQTSPFTRWIYPCRSHLSYDEGDPESSYDEEVFLNEVRESVLAPGSEYLIDLSTGSTAATGFGEFSGAEGGDVSSDPVSDVYNTAAFQLMGREEGVVECFSE